LPQLEVPVSNTGSRQDSVDGAAFRRLVGFWAPRRLVTSAGIDVEAFVADIQEKIRTRGFITSDGQVLTSLVAVEPWDVCFEPGPLDSTLDFPEFRPWGDEQRAYFGLDNPYQMPEDGSKFTWSHIMTVIADPYLAPDELIAGVVHGEQDRSYFTCPCHYASVVYTTRHRLMCMSCGATHMVLRAPLPVTPRQRLTAAEWDQIFGDDGGRHDEEVDLAIVDVRDFENAEAIWTTDQWDEALTEFVLFARSSPEEFAAAVRGTELDPALGSLLLEDGWSSVSQAPAPAFQLRAGSVDVDLGENAQEELQIRSRGIDQSVPPVLSRDHARTST
jgi:hypothetical protein